MRQRAQLPFYDGGEHPLYQRFLGAELEYSSVEGEPTQTTRAILCKWGVAVKRDGSLRGAHPREIVLPPARGLSYVEAVTETVGAIGELSPLCGDDAGTHIHVDCRDLGGPHLYRLLRLWCHVEPTIFRAVPASRQRGGYARPVWGHTIPLHWQWQPLEIECTAADPGFALRAGAQRITLGPRYQAANFTSLDKYGTVEFRLFPACADPKHVLGYSAIVSRLVHVCRTYRPSWLYPLLDVDPRETLESILDDETNEFLDDRIATYGDTA